MLDSWDLTQVPSRGLALQVELCQACLSLTQAGGAPGPLTLQQDHRGPPGDGRLTNIVTAFSWPGKQRLSCVLLLGENTARVQPPACGWASGEATYMLPPPSLPVIVPLKWCLIFQSV